jgi:hypothetical protein
MPYFTVSAASFGIIVVVSYWIYLSERNDREDLFDGSIDESLL